MTGVYLKGLNKDRKEVWYFHVTFEGQTYHRRGGNKAAAIRRRESEQERIDKGLKPSFLEKEAQKAAIPTVAAVCDAYSDASKGQPSHERKETFAAHLKRLLP